MAQYCTCTICKKSPAQPAQLVQGPIEKIAGAQVDMQAGYTLAHWSGRNFLSMTSIEIHNFQAGGKLRIGCSFYLYTGAVPRSRPQQLVLMGLGGGNRYTIGGGLAGLEVYYKSKTPGNPAEVTVCLGCGGTITFGADGVASSVNSTLSIPTVTIL